MPRVSEEILFSISFNLLKSSGASDEEARVVSEHCIDANLAGHDSHGIIQIDDSRFGKICKNSCAIRRY